MKPTDGQLQRAIAKLLPDELCVYVNPQFPDHPTVFWGKITRANPCAVLNTEWEHVIWLVENTLTPHEASQLCARAMNWNNEFEQRNHPIGWGRLHVSWQQRAEDILKVKSIEIV